MSLRHRQRAVARLLIDPEYRAKFFRPDARADELGIEEDDLVLLSGLDGTRLDVVGEGYVGKRLERLVSRFPLAAARLTMRATDWWEGYLATTRCTDPQEEGRVFRTWLEAAIPPHPRRFLLDLVDVEERLRALERLPRMPFRLHDDLLVAMVSPSPLLRLRGDLVGAWWGAAAPERYPARATWHLVMRGASPPVRHVSDKMRTGLSNGTATLAHLRHTTGATDDDLGAWLSSGVLVPQRAGSSLHEQGSGGQR